MHGLADKRILISEDQPMLAALLQTILTQEGLEVVGVAADGQEAVEMAIQKRPDLILTDLDMPRMDGLTATRHILAEYPACVIFVTGSGGEQRREQAAQVGAAGYIRKPYTRQSLLEQLQDIVGHWQTGQTSLPE